MNLRKRENFMCGQRRGFCICGGVYVCRLIKLVVLKMSGIFLSKFKSV